MESADDVKATQSDPQAAEYARRTAAIAQANPGLYTVVDEFPTSGGGRPTPAHTGTTIRRGSSVRVSRVASREPCRYGVAEVPCPTLAVVDLHPVVCRALCAVTCVRCWACDVCRGIEPLRLPSARQE